MGVHEKKKTTKMGIGKGCHGDCFVKCANEIHHGETNNSLIHTVLHFCHPMSMPNLNVGTLPLAFPFRCSQICPLSILPFRSSIISFFPLLVRIQYIAANKQNTTTVDQLPSDLPSHMCFHSVNVDSSVALLLLFTFVHAHFANEISTHFGFCILFSPLLFFRQ